MCNHFNIEDRRKKQHFQHIMLYYLKKGKNATETPKKICAVCGEGAVTEQMCLKWFVKFSVEDMLDDAPQSSRPVEIDSYQTETLIENNQLIPCKRLLTHSKYPVLKIICSSLVIFIALMFGFHISRENLDCYLHVILYLNDMKTFFKKKIVMGDEK